MLDRDNIKVLLVEDNALVVEILSVAFSKAGFNIFVDKDGSHTIELAKEEHPKVVLLDIRLPDSHDGIEILNKIKQDADLKDIPVLMLTNLTDQRLVTAAVELGARGYFVKSEMSYDEVVKKVKEIVESG